ncbi:beta-lactamase [Clostridium sulfidigenes]|uniref:Beta-lactamase n=1 Tax=Clostridium sulfidigenes TaxID=318464 RepID=A0A084J7J1_9CLOT|nr:serine hydrolase [Clostridium sulfidigenes]KEZ84925.1 beta-lactamase [Clostridium sulfidigenes]
MKEIKRYLETREGEYSFYFADLKSDYTYGFNEDLKMVAAGCIKLPIAMAVMKEVESTNIFLDQLVTITNEDKVSGSFGIIHELEGRQYSIKELIVAMLIQSDNTAACKLINTIGKDRINSIIHDMGLTSTFIKKYPSGKKEDFDNENITTSYDLCKGLALLSKGKVLNEKHSKFILEVIRRNQLTTGISFYWPKDFKVKTAHKAGSLEGIENDIVLLNLEKGDFVFVVMSRNLPSNVYGVSSLTRVGKMMFDIIDKDWN